MTPFLDRGVTLLTIPSSLSLPIFTTASFYVGRGEYDLFVRTSDDELVKRKVQLGDSNFEYVEVVSGLQPGDVVVVSDMSSYKNKNKLKMR